MNFLDYSNPRNRVIGNILRAQAQAVPQQTFIRTDEQRISYAEAYALARRYARGLRRLGVGKGDRVCIYMGSGPEFVLLSLACNLAGAQWVPINTDYRGEWLQQTIDDSEPAAIITDSHYIARLQEVAPLRCNTVIVRDDTSISIAPNQVTLAQLGNEAADDFEPVDADYGDVASVMWTSGTTGKSKGVMQSHNAWVRSALSSAMMGKMQRGDVIYICMPLYNSAAWVAGIYHALVSGVQCALDPAFSASTFWARTRYYGATHIFTLGAMHMFLWNAPRADDDASNPVRSANMIPMPEDLLAPFRQRFGIDAIHQGFGQSEIMLLLRRCDDGSRAWKANALGEAADDIEVALLDDHDRPVATGDVGEFCVRAKAPHVLFSGYFNNPQATDEAFRNGWFHTGDLGRRDDEGHFYFVDRKKDLIRYKGRSVSSVAVEAITRRHPAVRDVAAFGIPSRELASEHEIMLAVVPRDGEQIDPEQLARFINQNAPHFFVPRYIETVAELPMTPTQKVRKNILRERGITPATWDAHAAGFKVER